MNYLSLTIFTIYLFIKRAVPESTKQVSSTVVPVSSSFPYVVTIVAAISAILGIVVLVLILKCILAVCLKLFVPRPLNKKVDTEADPTYVNKSSNSGFLTSQLYYNVIPSKCDKQVQVSPRTLESGESNNHYYVDMHPARRDNEYEVGSLRSDIEQPCYSSLQPHTQYDYVTNYSAREKSAPCDPPKDSYNYELVYPACSVRRDQPRDC